MTDTHWLSENFTKSFDLPDPAVGWLLALYDALQVFDDVADGDPVSRKDLNITIWNTLVGMIGNPFFAAHAAPLLSVVSTLILKWQASDTVERQGAADARSFVWRAGYFDVVLMAVLLCHGPDYAAANAHHVMALYDEDFTEYLNEFNLQEAADA